MTLEYKKEQLSSFNLHVLYRYRAANQQLLNTWGSKRMTGFRLSWGIDNQAVDKMATTCIVKISPKTMDLMLKHLKEHRIMSLMLCYQCLMVFGGTSGMELWMLN